METPTLQVCQVCGQSVATSAMACSSECELGVRSIEDLSSRLKDHKPDDDKRVFFFDMGFGELADRYTVYLLRRLHQKNLREQQETDRILARLDRAIITKYNRTNFDKHTRSDIAGLIDRLHRTNAEMWRLRTRYFDTRIPPIERQEAAMGYFNISGHRDNARRQLDFIVDGRSTLICARLYAAQD